jgi:hypothetical protein
MKKITGLVLSAFLASAVSPWPVSAAELLQNHGILDQNSVVVENGEKSASITLQRPTGGITQIALVRLDFSAKDYVTMVTASGPTRENIAMAVAVLQTFAKLNQETLLVGTDSSTESITLVYNKTQPSHVISELERVKLISPSEAQAARTAFDSLQSQTDTSQVFVHRSSWHSTTVPFIFIGNSMY